jgi:Glycosyltransferase family 9 (heptosyltransferase)
MQKIVMAPAGQGDWSWIWSKLCHVADEIAEVRVPSGWPNRTVPFIELCGLKADYLDIDYPTIQANMAVHGCETWAGYREHPACGMAVSANRHLELGKPLAEYLPDLPTDYHYPLPVTQEDIDVAARLTQDLPRPLIGISCASYRGSEAWKTWGRGEWTDCLQRMQAEGLTPVLLGGFWDDLTHYVATNLSLPDLVGKTSVAECVAVLNALDGYVGFSSGLGVIRTVLRKSSFMLWPEFQCDLATSWPDPEDLETGKYEPSPWDPVDTVWPYLYKHFKQNV